MQCFVVLSVGIIVFLFSTEGVNFCRHLRIFLRLGFSYAAFLASELFTLKQADSCRPAEQF